MRRRRALLIGATCTAGVVSPWIGRAGQDGGPFADDAVCRKGVDLQLYGGREALARALAQASGTRATFLRGCHLLGDHRWNAAALEFEALVSANGGNAVYHYWAGRAHADQAQHAYLLRRPGLARKARSDFERAVALSPDYIDAREALVQYYLTAPGIVGGSPDRARAQAGEMRRRDPYRGGLAMARVATRAGAIAAAIAAYDSLIAEFPDSGGPLLSLAALYGGLKQWDAVWRVVDHLARDRPDWPPTRYAVGQAAAESGAQLDRGEKALRQYLAHVPRPGEPAHVLTYWRLGMILERRGDRDGARRAWEAAQEIEPGHAGTREALRRLGQGAIDSAQRG